MASPKAHSTQVTVTVRHGGRELRLAPGVYIVGRHSSCAVVLDSSLVSRQHARLEVTRAGATLEDLQSANGVYVNAERITSLVRLRSGDFVLLGDQELELHFSSASGPISVLRPSSPVLKLREDDAAHDEAPHSGTRQVDFFALVGRVVDRVLAEGRFDEAITMLQSHLSRVLADARAGRPVEREISETSLRYALAIAAGTRDPRWLDYVFDLLTALGCAPGEQIAEDLEAAMLALGYADEPRVQRYVTAATAIADARERLRVAAVARAVRRGGRH